MVAPNTDQNRRARLEAAIEIAIALLDAADADPDLESNGDDEPHLGWTSGGPNWNDRLTDDREQDVGDEGEPDEDREHSLGWTEAIDQQQAMRRDGWNLDEGEPSLGWTTDGEIGVCDDGEADAELSREDGE